jgi:hypothetical protein
LRSKMLVKLAKLESAARQLVDEPCEGEALLFRNWQACKPLLTCPAEQMSTVARYQVGVQGRSDPSLNSALKKSRVSRWALARR